jgi:hypothetical protein
MTYLAANVSERIKIKRSNLGLAKKYKQLDERICVLFLLNLQNKLGWFILAPVLMNLDKTLLDNRLSLCAKNQQV